MKTIRKIIILFLVLALVLPLVLTARAAETTADDLILQIINYYRYYQDEARTDFDLLLEEMEELDPALAESWEGILDFWTRLNRDMNVHESILPDGLPNDDSLCIVVMGFYLEPDGGIREELKKRLEVTLASAEKYPNAYILCTGGGTASNNKKVTEAGQMAAWLEKQGISKDRIITETEASSTIENAIFGCELLYRDYPQIRSLAVITSDYHVRRSCLYFNTQAALDAYSAKAEPIQVLAGASCPIKGESATDVETQAEGMCILNDLKLTGSKPTLSVLQEITVSSESGVQAVYSSGVQKDISGKVTYEVLEMDGNAPKTVTVTYVVNGQTHTTVAKMEDLPKDAKVTLPAMELSAGSKVTAEETIPLEGFSISATAPVTADQETIPLDEISLSATAPVTADQETIPLDEISLSATAPVTYDDTEPAFSLSTALLIAGLLALLVAVLLTVKSRRGK